jgi:hypothetical protein
MMQQASCFTQQVAGPKSGFFPSRTCSFRL